MALRFPINSGSWSNSAIWSGSLIPTSADDVFANNKIVIIDQDVTVQTLRTTTSGSAAAGGTFAIYGDYTVNCLAATGSFAATTPVITYYGSGSASFNSTTTTTSAYAIFKSGSGTLNMSASVFGPTNFLSILGSGVTNITASNILLVSYTVNVPATAPNPKVLNLRGTVNNPLNIPAGAGKYGIRTLSDITINLIGDIYAGSPGFNLEAAFQRDTGNMDVDIKGNVICPTTYNGWCVAYGRDVTVTGSIYNYGNAGYGCIGATQRKLSVSGSAYSGVFSPAIYETIAEVTIKDGIISGSATQSAVSMSGASIANTLTLDGCSIVNGKQLPGTSKSAILAPYIYIKPNSNTRWTMWDPTQTSQYTMYAQGFVPDSPIPSDVRFGTAYLGGTLSGSMVVPNSGSVLFGVQVDNGTGSYSVTADQISEAVWNKAVSTLTGSNSIGQRLANSSTVSSTGAQIAAFGI